LSDDLWLLLMIDNYELLIFGVDKTSNIELAVINEEWPVY
jgi:hypothetical protein